jgi:hypothetical protein
MADEPSPFAVWGHASAKPPAGADAFSAPLDPIAAPRQRHVRVTAPRLILCALLAAGVAAAVVVALGSSGAPLLKTLRAASFTTVVPAGYIVTLVHPLSGFNSFQLLGGTAADLAVLDDGVPPAGTIGLTVSEVPVTVASAATNNPHLATLAPAALLALLVKLPASASHIAVAEHLHGATIDGEAAAAISYSYTYRGFPNVQSDVVTRHGGQLVGVELVSGPALAAQGAAAERTVLSHWAWNAPLAAN